MVGRVAAASSSPSPPNRGLRGEDGSGALYAAATQRLLRPALLEAPAASLDGRESVIEIHVVMHSHVLDSFLRYHLHRGRGLRILSTSSFSNSLGAGVDISAV